MGAAWRRNLTELGFDGGMLDLGELVTPRRFANGQDGLDDAQPLPTAVRPGGLRRGPDLQADLGPQCSGSPAAQAYQHLRWPGDPHVSWGPVSGFQSMLPAALSAGLSGLPYWHPEIGGLAAGLPTASERELWQRWLQPALQQPAARHLRRPPDRPTAVEVWSDDETIEAFDLRPTAQQPGALPLQLRPHRLRDQPAADAAPGAQLAG